MKTIQKFLGGLCVLALPLTVSAAPEGPATPFRPTLQREMLQDANKQKQQNLEIVQKAVEGIGENLPQKVDRYTTLTGIESNGTRLIYIFEVDGGVRTDEALREDGKKRMAPVIKAGICSGSKRFLQADIEIRYRYLSKRSHAEILRVDVSKKACP